MTTSFPVLLCWAMDSKQKELQVSPNEKLSSLTKTLETIFHPGVYPVFDNGSAYPAITNPVAQFALDPSATVVSIFGEQEKPITSVRVHLQDHEVVTSYTLMVYFVDSSLTPLSDPLLSIAVRVMMNEPLISVLSWIGNLLQLSPKDALAMQIEIGEPLLADRTALRVTEEERKSTPEVKSHPVTPDLYAKMDQFYTAFTSPSASMTCRLPLHLVDPAIWVNVKANKSYTNKTAFTQESFPLTEPPTDPSLPPSETRSPIIMEFKARTIEVAISDTAMTVADVQNIVRKELSSARHCFPRKSTSPIQLAEFLYWDSSTKAFTETYDPTLAELKVTPGSRVFVENCFR